MTPLMPASVAWYVTGRFYVSSDGKTVQDLGYFLHLEGITGSLFTDPKVKSEATARLTFRSALFKPDKITNGGLSLSLDPVGDFTLYLKGEKHARSSFYLPDSFSDGTPIATFRRASVVVGGAFSIEPSTQRALSLNVFTARLVWSAEFELDGQRYDLRHLLPHGITQWGQVGPSPVPLTPEGFSSVLPFLGSAVAVGPGGAR
ncbi:hypothetical protein HPC49_33475 [Pyxidicoccus fallax]|uniref:Uncharacterized protein n=1 Tax=Pyxidicoccus fallax TaxID=394095 RepID=A0A848LML4_9BACT|nr:hypothetical protein [Pyxidicoccus fallax]NMO18976.1 hypothetical protein [Pyxidicoccus fallax]NPC83120.1 hypothetical protein [Pyxidicoccus fallax]